MQRHLALVEDNQIILDNYADFLGGAGFEVDRYNTKESALQGLHENEPELLLLDIQLNHEQDAGFAICAEVRARNPILPIIFLTSHGSEVDQISGWRLGADDYITKDVSLDCLVVRIEALFRRLDVLTAPRKIEVPPQRGSVVHSGIEFDTQASTATWRGREVELTLTQFWLVQELCKAPGEAKSNDQLMQAAKIQVEPNTIAAHVKAIRSAFAKIDSSFDRIRTERGRGYRWLPS